MDVEGRIDRLETRLRAVASPERAAGEKRYLKSELDFLGVTVWQIRVAGKEISAERRDLAQGTLSPWSRRCGPSRSSSAGWDLSSSSSASPSGSGSPTCRSSSGSCASR